MKKNKLFLALISVLLITFLAACGGGKGSSDKNNDENAKKAEENLTESGMPIVNDQIELKFFTGKSDSNANIDWNELPLWDKYTEMTNIKVNWSEQVTQDALAEKRNLALAGGNLPDVFYAAGISNTDLYKYGQQGTFIELNDLIDKHAPNLKAFLDENPNVLKGLTFPDGKIYSLPSLRNDDFLSIRIGAIPWFNTEWLETLDMDIPETTDEFYDYLTAVKNENPSGDKNIDEIPYGGVNIDHLFGWLRGAFGIGNNGVGYIDLEPGTEDIRFIPASDGYKEMLEYVHKLYEEELIQQNIFSIEWGQFMANAAEGRYGTTVFWDPARTFAGEEGQYEYIGGSALKGPHGDQVYSTVFSPLYDIGGFVITKENPDPAATVRWLDFFYSDEGARFLYMGIEGETYEKAEDGSYKYVDEIENHEDKNQIISEYLPWVGVNPPGLVKKEYFIGSETSEATLEVTDRIEPYVPEDLWAKFTYTEEETKFLSSKGADVEKYVDEQRDKFITGDVSFDDWDKYIETLENIGLEEYIEVQQAAYDRYMED